MNKKTLPVLAVALGLAAGVAMDQQANAEEGLFGMSEVAPNGLLMAEHHEGDEHKCGGDHCGKDKDGDDHCGKDKCGSDKCGKDACGSHKS